MAIDYNNRSFRGVSNSSGGDVDEETVFHYRQKGRVVWATYEGGAILLGTLTAVVLDDGRLDMRYQQVAPDGTFKTGRCVSVPEVLPDGRLRLHESWRWTEGGAGSGQSRVEEIGSGAISEQAELQPRRAPCETGEAPRATKTSDGAFPTRHR